MALCDALQKFLLPMQFHILYFDCQTNIGAHIVTDDPCSRSGIHISELEILESLAVLGLEPASFGMQVEHSDHSAIFSSL